MISTGDECVREARLLDSLLSLESLLCDAEEPQRVLNEEATCVGSAIGAAMVVIALLNEDGQILRVGGVYADSWVPACELGDTFPMAQLIDDVTSLTVERPILANASTANVFVSKYSYSEDRLASPVLLPLAARGAVLGTLFVVPGAPAMELDPAQLRLCQIVARRIGSSLAAERSRASHHNLFQGRVGAQLVQVILDGEGLPGLAAALGRIFRNSVLITDGSLYILAASPNQEGIDQYRRDCIEQCGTARKALSDPRVRHLFQTVIKHGGPLEMPTFPEFGWVQRRISAPIMAGKELLGRVTVAESQHPFADSDHAVLKEATVALALEMTKQRAILETERRLKADFLADLLCQQNGDKQSVIARASLLGIDLLRRWALMLVDIDESCDLVLDYEDVDTVAARQRVFETIESMIRMRSPRGVVVVYRGKIVVLVPASATDGSAVRRVAEAIRPEVARVSSSISISVGIGQPCTCIEDFAMSYAQARRALDVVHGLGRSNVVVTLDDLGVYGLLFHNDDPREFQRFASGMVGCLLEYDRKHGSALINTLQVYLEENCNHRKTAERLYVHPNTLSSRLERIAAIGSFDLQDSKTRLSLQLAIGVLKLAWPMDKEMGKIESRQKPGSSAEMPSTGSRGRRTSSASLSEVKRKRA
jgi:sugar diacid utilization regulator